MWTEAGSELLMSMVVSHDWSNNTGVIDMKIQEFVLEEKSPFKMLELSLLNWIGLLHYPPPFKIFQMVPPTLTQLPPALTLIPTFLAHN